MERLDNLVNQPKTKRGEATLERILATAEQNFFEKGYHGTSIVDITQSADIALGTFYIYFKDKESLYRYLLTTYSHDIRKAISVATEHCTTRRERERLGLKTFLEYIRDNKHVYNIIWEALYIDKTLFDDYYMNFARRYIVGIEDAQVKGEIYSDLDPEIVSYFLMGVSNFIGLRYVMFDDRNQNFDWVVDQVMKLLDRSMFVEDKK